MPPKSLAVGFALWLVGGLWGWHHLYLGRDSQAVLYAASFGGFGLGWLRDAWRLPDLVADANDAAEFVAVFKTHLAFRPRRAAVFSAVPVAQLLFGLWLRTVAINVVPSYADERPPLYHLWAGALGALAAAAGVFLVETAGFRRTGTWAAALRGAVAGELLTVWISSEESLADGALSGLFPVLLAMVAIARTRAYLLPAQRRPAPRAGVCVRVTRYSAAAAIFWMVVLAGVYLNGAVSTADGGELRVRDCLTRIAASPAWRQFADTLAAAWAALQREGWSGFTRAATHALDADGTRRAHADLELAEGASPDEIRAAHKKFAMLYHPDKCRLADPAECAGRFTAVQAAYELLTGKHDRRGGRARSAH